MQSLQDFIRAAREREAAGDLDGAISLFEAILGQAPGHALTLHALGTLLIRRANFSRAASLLEQAVVLSPGEAAWHIDLGESYRNLGMLRDAVGCCLTGLRIRPEYPEGMNTLGLTFRDSGNLEGALEQFLEAIACREDFYPARVNAATVLQELGRADQAIPHLRWAAGLAPEPGPARTSLGLALLGVGRYEEARIELELAARLLPDSAVAQLNLGDALRLLGRTQDARSCYLKAARIDPGLPTSHFRVGMTLRCEGSLDDALTWYKMAVEMEPGEPKFWEELADLYHQRDEPDEAVLCRQRLIDLPAADPVGARLSLGFALQVDGRHDEALEQYRLCLEIEPNSARTQFALSATLEEQGRLAEAEAALREAIRLEPRFPAAHARLAMLLRGKLPEDDLLIVERLIDEPEQPPRMRARLLFSLAQVLDARREHARAASILVEANELISSIRRAEGLVHDPDDHERFVSGLIRCFDAEFFRRLAGCGLETRRPIFIVGLPRSGTTLIEQVLASHPRVFGAGEQLFGRRSFEKIPSLTRPGDAALECVASLDELTLKRLAGEHLGKLNALDLCRFERIVDKLPDNYFYLGLLYAMFPKATFIHCRRDLRDVALSCWMSDFHSVPWANELIHIGSQLLQYRRLTAHWEGVFPATLHHVDYEETVSDLEGVARRLLAACGLEWDPACLDFHSTRRSVRTASLTQVRQPIYKTSVGRWRNYEAGLGELFAMIAGDNPGRT